MVRALGVTVELNCEDKGSNPLKYSIPFRIAFLKIQGLDLVTTFLSGIAVHIFEKLFSIFFSFYPLTGTKIFSLKFLNTAKASPRGGIPRLERIYDPRLSNIGKISQ